MEANKTNLFLLFFLKYNEFIEQQKKKKKSVSNIPFQFSFHFQIEYILIFVSLLTWEKQEKKKK